MDQENDHTFIIKRPTMCKRSRNAIEQLDSNTLSTKRVRRRVKCSVPNCCDKSDSEIESKTNQTKGKGRTNISSLANGGLYPRGDSNSGTVEELQEPVNITYEGNNPQASPSLNTGTILLSQSLMELVHPLTMTPADGPHSTDMANSRSGPQFRVRKTKECPICGKTFPTGIGAGFRNHLEIHEGKKPFVCPTCQFGFETDIMLLEHVSRHHWNGAVFECRLCERLFKTHSGLRSHEVKKHNSQNERI